ncbi:MAG: SoxR reducing system RseC family protein [Firmicutes bacterium]|nr:SoxR reducing system RseC family protein [Bacillota bacterium]
MQKAGVVVSTSNSTAEVRIEQLSACAGCGKCHMAHESRSLLVSARNRAGALPGDRVLLTMPKSSVFQAGLLAYTLPLVAMFLGAFLGQAIAGQAGSLLGGFGLLGSSYWLLRRLEPCLAGGSKFVLEITQIINEEELSNRVPQTD